jgi:hypothetical protein
MGRRAASRLARKGLGGGGRSPSGLTPRQRPPRQRRAARWGNRTLAANSSLFAHRCVTKQRLYPYRGPPSCAPSPSGKPYSRQLDVVDRLFAHLDRAVVRAVIAISPSTPTPTRSSPDLDLVAADDLPESKASSRRTTRGFTASCGQWIPTSNKFRPIRYAFSGPCRPAPRPRHAPKSPAWDNPARKVGGAHSAGGPAATRACRYRQVLDGRPDLVPRSRPPQPPRLVRQRPSTARASWVRRRYAKHVPSPTTSAISPPREGLPDDAGLRDHLQCSVFECQFTASVRALPPQAIRAHRSPRGSCCSWTSIESTATASSRRSASIPQISSPCIIVDRIPNDSDPAPAGCVSRPSAARRSLRRRVVCRTTCRRDAQRCVYCRALLLRMLKVCSLSADTSGGFGTSASMRSGSVDRCRGQRAVHAARSLRAS